MGGTILIYIMIIVLFCFILFNIKCSNTVMEGATGEYEDPGLDEDPLYLAKTNAANIAYLKGQLDTITDMKTDLDAMNEQVESNSTAIQSLNSSIQDTGTGAIPDQQTTEDLANTGTADATVPS